MRRSIRVVFVIASLAGAAVAQPGPGEPAAAPAGDLKAQCGAAIAADDAWARDLVTTEQMIRLVKAIHAEQLVEMSRRAHIDDAARIAKNKRHVIMAYAAMWLLSAGFLVFLWRRQAGLRGQIDQLKRDLDAALKDGK